MNASPLPPPAGWCGICDADFSDEPNHYHCAKCHRRTGLLGHSVCPQPVTPAAPQEPDSKGDRMIDTRVQRVTTTVVRRSMKTPVNWNEVMKVTSIVTRELNSSRGRPVNATPSDDAMWFEPGPDDDEISLCYELTKTEDVRQ